ncbi:MAG: hypothetical protein M3R00_02860, partial [Pseudomonadota bacterium]|nr:hypothetical protein [Pseudomonadota bacterium]
MNKITLYCLVIATACWSMIDLAATEKSDNTTIVSFTRHTFRGTTKNIGPQKVDLRDFGINISVQNLSYAKSATPRGLEIARDQASKSLQKAAAQGVKALGESKSFDGHWDEIRADLATERTFWTALKLRDGLKANFPTQNVNLFASGCRTEPGKGIDVISTDHAITACTPKEYSRPLLTTSRDLPILKMQAETFLGVVRSSIGKKGPSPKLPTPVYNKNENLSSSY